MPRRGNAGRRLAAVLIAGFAALAISPPVQASALPASATPPTAAADDEMTTQPLCEAPAEGRFSCFALRRVNLAEKRAEERAEKKAGTEATPDGYGPADLLDAYNLPADGGSGQTVAVVAAFDSPTAEADLAVYRAQFGLPPCTTANGCFKKVDQRGGTDYPDADPGWAGEMALDLDMISAVAPRARLLLVEADSNFTDDLGAAVDQAVAMGAKYVNNSYGSSQEYPDQTTYDVHYNHPGVAIVAAAGDSGHGASYPAASPYVTSVGGTSLVRDSGERGWSETVWNSSWLSGDGNTYWGATGSGCSKYGAKPGFQTDTGCPGRTIADVSAVSDPVTGVAVYNSYLDGGWGVYGGTSAASPIVTGIYATAGSPVDGSEVNSYPYDNAAALYDVVKGDNASCPAGLCRFGTTPACEPTYLCVARAGYDGPTGLGTPNGTTAFRASAHGTVTGKVTDKATGEPIPGAQVRLGTFTATTEADGGYELVIPVGDYTGTAGAYGYTEAAIGAITLAEDQRLTLDVPLEPLASQVVSGTVTDGGGQGWPLYARVAVEGVPGAPVFTDPATGTYAVKLPLGHQYQLTISAEFPGYLPKSETVDVGDKPVTLNTALPVDAGKANAAGYSLTYPDGGVQTFDERTAPVGWTVRDNNDKGGWRFDDPLGRSNQTGGGGGFAIVDDFAEGWAKLDTELLSPAYDLTKVKTPVAEFETHFPPLEQLDVPKATVDVSVDGGTTWSTAWTSPKTLAGPAHVSVPLAAFAGEKDVRLRFHYVGGLGNMWEIDKVAVGTRTFAPVKGGLVVGLVSDANTGEGVLGATVYSEGHSHGHGHRDKPQTEGRAITVATPDDTALGDGLYGLFSPETGRREVTADKAAFGYPATSEAARVTSGTVRADIALAAGRISVTPAAVDSAVTWGGDKDVTVTVRNTGKGPATFTVGEQPGGGTAPTTLTEAGTPAISTPLHRVKAGPPTGFGSGHKGEPGQAAPRPGDTWRTLADLDMGATGMVAGTYDGKLYAGTGARDDGTNRFSNAFASYDPESGKWTTLTSPWYRRWSGVGGFINGRFYVTSGRDTRGKTVAATEFYDPATNKWQTVAPNPTPYGSSGSAVLDGKLYVVGGCYMGPQGGDTCANSTVMVYDPAADKWSKTTSYPLGISHLACGGVAGKVYCAGGGSRGGATSDGFAYDPETAAWTAIADMPVDLMASAYTSANGKLLVSTGYSTGLGAITNEGYAYDPAAGTWSPLPNANVATTFAAGAPGFYVVGGDSPETGAPLTQLEQLPGYDQPHGQVAWMSVKARTTTLRAGQSVKVTLKLAADRRATSVLTAYTATVVLDTDTPYRATTVPVTMRVVKRH